MLCGAEVQGHITGQTIKALHEYGADEDLKIIGANGAIPYLDNITEEAIQRFRDQVEIVDLVDIEDAQSIQSKIKECAINDAGAYEEINECYWGCSH